MQRIWIGLGAGWMLVGCGSGLFRRSADEFCELEEARAQSCDASFNTVECLRRMESCRGRDVDVLTAYSDCLEDLGYGVCGRCIAEDLISTCSGEPSVDDVPAVDACIVELFDGLSSSCEAEFRGCSNVDAPPSGLLIVVLFLLGLRRRGTRIRSGRDLPRG